MTTEDNDPTTFGNLYWYRHKGWQTGTQEWEGKELIGRGGWQEYKSVFASSDGAIYAIDWDGNLWWYRYQRGQPNDGWSGHIVVNRGGWNTYKSVFATSDGVIYAMDWNGDLWWYRHKGWQTGTNEFEGRRHTGQGGMQKYMSVFATSQGVLYAISSDGYLHWFRHHGWQDGSAAWQSNVLVSEDYRWGTYKSVFATSEGVLYCINPDGELYWRRHLGWHGGNSDWEDWRLIDPGGWQVYSNVFVTSDGVLFAIHNNVASRIKHIVYLMLENRSLDNVLGWLYADGQRPARVIAPSGHDSHDYNGLREETYFNLDWNGIKHYVTRGTDNNSLWVPVHDPQEDYVHINMQLFETVSNPSPGQTPTMGGFLQDYENTTAFKPLQIMQSYEPRQLKVLNGAARHWAVSDAYFSSVPTQTNCNRAFAATGNSLAPNFDDGALTAWVNNNMGRWKVREWTNPPLSYYDFYAPLYFNQRTMFNVLSDAGKDWMVFASELWDDGFCFTRDILLQLHDERYDSHFDTIDAFFDRVKNDKLPAVSFLEPEWGYAYDAGFGPQGNDYHPPMNIAPGEAFVARILNALQDSPSWNEILLIINFDEHGGTYDHVAPPRNAAVPWGGHSPTPAPAKSEHDFGFDRFGVRVPLILASPYIEESTVFRAGDIPYDHTSVIATILTMMGIPKDSWGLGNRVHSAPSFENVLTRSAPRTDKHHFQTSTAVKAALTTDPKLDPPPNELQREIAFRRLRHHLKLHKDPETMPLQPIEPIMAPLAEARTLSELSDAVAKALGKKVID